MKQKLYDRNDFDGMKLIERFQREPDYPCKRRYGAAAVCTSTSVHQEIISSSNCESHPNADKIELLLVTADQLMTLVHELYRRAADEA